MGIAAVDIWAVLKLPSKTFEGCLLLSSVPSLPTRTLRRRGSETQAHVQSATSKERKYNCFWGMITCAYMYNRERWRAVSNAYLYFLYLFDFGGRPRGATYTGMCTGCPRPVKTRRSQSEKRRTYYYCCCSCCCCCCCFCRCHR